LTGGNGFLGKVIVAYLLDRFPELKHLYLVIRPKWDLPAEARFYDETLASPALVDGTWYWRTASTLRAIK